MMVPLSQPSPTRGEGKIQKESPLILEIKGNSLDDGPGIRTVVFFKGCPLSCAWCHNPESKRAVAEIAFDANECVGCDDCVRACPRGALDRDNPWFVDRSRCDLCFLCADGCPSGALSRVGRAMLVDEVIAEVAKDVPFFRTSGGGVTLSGGEPTLFMPYCSELLQRARALGAHTLLETCGLFELAQFDKLLYPQLDVIYYDLKLIDTEAHRRHCGADNAVILRNFHELLARSLAGGVEVLPRLPLIPGITDTDENLAAVRSLLEDCGAYRIALLQYNPLWVAKSAKVGLAAGMQGEAAGRWMPQAEVERCRAAFAGLEVL